MNGRAKSQNYMKQQQKNGQSEDEMESQSLKNTMT